MGHVTRLARNGENESKAACATCLDPDSDSIQRICMRLFMEHPEWTPRRRLDRAHIEYHRGVRE